MKTPPPPTSEVFQQESPVFVGRYQGEDVFRPNLVHVGFITCPSHLAMAVAKVEFNVAAPVLQEVKNVTH
jgi:hypothetical protein